MPIVISVLDHAHDIHLKIGLLLIKSDVSLENGQLLADKLESFFIRHPEIPHISFEGYKTKHVGMTLYKVEYSEVPTGTDYLLFCVFGGGVFGGGVFLRKLKMVGNHLEADGEPF